MTSIAKRKNSPSPAAKRSHAQKPKTKIISVRLPRGQADKRIPQILAAAMAAFTELGFVGASMDDIAARVGVSKPIIYRHFKSKKELLEVLLSRDLTPDLLRTIPMIRQYAGPLKQLLQVLIARIDPTLPSRQATIPMFRLILSDGYRVPEFAKNFHRANIQPISEALAEVFVRAMADGKMRKANANFAARELFAPYMHMIVTLSLTGREQFGPWQGREYLNHALDSFIRSYEIAD